MTEALDLVVALEAHQQVQLARVTDGDAMGCGRAAGEGDAVELHGAQPMETEVIGHQAVEAVQGPKPTVSLGDCVGISIGNRRYMCQPWRSE
jgi:hypothetical protein